MDAPARINAEQLAEIWTAKLANIVKLQGYQTDIGTRVFRGRRQILTDNIPCVVIVEGDDRPIDDDSKQQGFPASVLVNQHYVFEAYDFGDADHPNDQCHKIIRDLKKATFAKDDVLRRRITYLRYSGRNIGAREDGTTIVAAYIEIDVGFVEELRAA